VIEAVLKYVCNLEACRVSNVDSIIGAVPGFVIVVGTVPTKGRCNTACFVCAQNPMSFAGIFSHVQQLQAV